MSVGKLPQSNDQFRSMLLAGAKNREKRQASDSIGTLNKADKKQLKKRGLFQKDTDNDGE